MSTIRAACETCGDIELSTRDVTVRVCAETGRGDYLFRCPRCRMMVAKPGEPQTLQLLVEAGATRQQWALPRELFEARGGAPITADDVLDFHEALYDPVAWHAGLDEVFGEPA